MSHATESESKSQPQPGLKDGSEADAQEAAMDCKPGTSRKRPNPDADTNNAKEPDTNPKCSRSNTARRGKPFQPRGHSNGGRCLEVVKVDPLIRAEDLPSALESVKKEEASTVPDMSTVTVPVREPLDRNSVHEPELKVLNNELIFDEIASYLDQPTLKALSGTCTWLKELTRRCRKYVDCTKLRIYPGNLEYGVSTLNKFCFPWKTLRLSVDNWKLNQLKILKEICSSDSIENLELSILPKYRQEPTVSYSYHARLIFRPPSLKSLTLDSGILARDYFAKALNNKLKRQLAGLESLSIVPGPRAEDMDTTVRMDHLFNANLTRLFTIPNMHLKTFNLHRVDSAYLYEPELFQCFSSTVLTLLEGNAATLQNLTLHGRIWEEEKINVIVLPSLESLNVQMLSTDSERFVAFLDNQPLLLSLTMSLTKLTWFQDIPIEVIRRRSDKLKTLSLCWKLPRFQIMAGFDWNFLHGLQHLEDLEITQGVFMPEYFGMVGNTLGHILPKIPASVRSVRVNGSDGSWNGGADDRMNCFSRFFNLNQLNLMNCPNSISDPVLQYICSNMTQLTTLEFEKCLEVTDFGLTGRRRTWDSGISLLNLKGLRKLGIHRVDISAEAAKSVIAFLELKELALTNPLEWELFTADAIGEIGRQNPSLQHFGITLLTTIGPREVVTLARDEICAELQKVIPKVKGFSVQIELEIPLVSDDERKGSEASDSDDSDSDSDDFDSDSDDFDSDSDYSDSDLLGETDLLHNWVSDME